MINRNTDKNYNSKSIKYCGEHYIMTSQGELNNNFKIELKDNNHSSIIVSLVKSNNIIASGSINLKYGEQWITLNSETKKKSSMNLALSLIDCIKLKIFCEIKNINKNGKNTTIYNS